MTRNNLASTQFVRWYRKARKQYRLSPVDAISYARDRQLLFEARSPMWGVEYVGESDTLNLFIYEEDEDHTVIVLDCLGGVHVSFEISDHGNVNTDEEAPFLVGLAAELVRNLP